MRAGRRLGALGALALSLAACRGRAHDRPAAPAVSTTPARSEDLRISARDTSLPLYPLAAIGDTERLLGSRKIRLASDGAVEYDYGALYGGAGWQFNPVTTASVCIGAYNEYVTSGGPGRRRLALEVADGLVRRAAPAGRGIVWRYGFANTEFGAARGWLSSMSQGLGAACLSGAGALTGEKRYLDAAARAIATLVAPDGAEGTAVRLPSGVWYEEVAGGGSRPSHILNGMIFALGGIWLANEIDPRPAYRAALANGLAGIRSLIDSFGTPGASLYDLRLRGLAPLGGYNLRHVEQMQWLYERTHDRHFLDVAFRFLAYERRLPDQIEASFGNGRVVAMPTDGHCRRSTTQDPVRLSVRFPAVVAPDRLVIVACPGASPAARISVKMGGVETHLLPTGRFSTVTLPSRPDSKATVVLAPRRGEHVSIALASFTTAAQRRLTAISSDIGSYFDRLRTPLNVADGASSTSWSTGRTDTWILAGFGEQSLDRLRIVVCDAHRPSAVSFSPDLQAWMAPEAPATSVRVPAGSRYVLLRWKTTGGCLRELA